MLAVSDAKYYIPIKTVEDDGDVSWIIQRRGSIERIVSRQFKYTIDVSHVYPILKRITFEYNGRSVKAAPRSLRICGAENIEWFTSKLANQTAPCSLLYCGIDDADGERYFQMVTEN